MIKFPVKFVENALEYISEIFSEISLCTIMGNGSTSLLNFPKKTCHISMRVVSNNFLTLLQKMSNMTE